MKYTEVKWLSVESHAGYTFYMSKIRVAVLRGGPSSEYEVSLKTGDSVLKNLSPEKYLAQDILIDKTGVWHVRGIPVEPHGVIRQSDVVVNALHGEWGEDGKVQQLLETFGMPYTGSRPLSSALGMHKLRTKQLVASHGVRTPRHSMLNVSDGLERRMVEIFRSFPQPSVIKPVNKGSSVGVTIARDWKSFRSGVSKAFNYSPDILIEEYIRGREATVGVVDKFRGEEFYTLLPIEIVPARDNDFYDYDAKYLSNETGYSIPGNFSAAEKEELMRLAQLVHRTLGLRHYSRSDFIVSPRGIYFLEVNTLPGLMDHSLIPKSMEAVGSSLPELLDHIIVLAMQGH